MLPDTCPHCHTSLDAGAIIDTLKEYRTDGHPGFQCTDEVLEEYMHLAYQPPYRWNRTKRINDALYCPDCEKEIFTHS